MTKAKSARPSRVTDATRKRVVRLYVDKKLSIDAISRMDGMPSEATISKILVAADIPRRAAKRFDHAKIIADIRSNPGATLQEIANRHGCSHMLVSTIRRDMIPPVTSPPRPWQP